MEYVSLCKYISIYFFVSTFSQFMAYLLIFLILSCRAAVFKPNEFQFINHFFHES